MVRKPKGFVVLFRLIFAVNRNSHLMGCTPFHPVQRRSDGSLTDQPSCINKCRSTAAYWPPISSSPRLGSRVASSSFCSASLNSAFLVITASSRASNCCWSGRLMTFSTQQGQMREPVVQFSKYRARHGLASILATSCSAFMVSSGFGVDCFHSYDFRITNSETLKWRNVLFLR